MVSRPSAGILAGLPSVDAVLHIPPVAALVLQAPRTLVVDAVRTAIARARAAALKGAVPDPAAIAAAAARIFTEEHRKGLVRVVNATGVILHTGLGRAPLSIRARQALEALSGYGSLELDLATNERGQRDRHVARLLARLTGAADACVVNNNAAATLIALSSLAAGKEVVVARGQLVEIGGSFRLPEVMEKSGARLREVGATNKVRLSDYAKAINKGTGLLMRVHTSNYKVMGFTEEVPIEELVKLGRKHKIPVMDDIGSGALVDFSRWGLPEEPTARRSIKAGADIICFSGDKLLGGPQAGILIGKRKPIEAVRKNPFYRAVRVGKTTLAPLQATLESYLSGDESAILQIPTLWMIRQTEAALRDRAETLARRIAQAAPALGATAERTDSQLGSGSMPTHNLPSWAVAIATPKAAHLASRLRESDPPILARVQKGKILLDLRTVDPSEEPALAAACAQLAK